jgi:hypothetical protein
MRNIQKKISLLAILCFSFSVAYAQTFKAVDNKGTIVDIVSSPWLTTGTAIYNKNSGNVVIGNGTAPGTVNPNAALQFTQTDKGILIPKVSLTATNSSAPFSSLNTDTANNGLLVYNTATAGTAPNNVIPGFYYWDAIAWKAIINLPGVTTFSAGTTGFSPSTATSGAITLGGTLNIANGGTGSSTQNFVDLTTNQTIDGIKQFAKATTNSTAYNAGAGTTIDFSQSNLAYTTANPGAFTLSNLKDGGTYTLAVQGATSGTAAFTSGTFTFKSVNNGPTTTGKHTLYTFIVMGTTVYFFMSNGF